MATEITTTARTTPTPSPSGRAVAPPRGSVAPLRASAAETKKSKLGGVTTGIVVEAKRFFFYGTKGVGKSTLAGDIPGALFIDLDRGSGHLPLARYPIDVDASYHDVLDAITDLTDSPHGYKALVIDEASKLEALIHRHVVESAPVDNRGNRPTTIEEVGGGFRKGYRVAETEWRQLMAKLDRLRVTRSMHVVILGHSSIANHKNPGGEDYHRHVPSIDSFAAGVLCGGADVVGFVTFDDVATRIGKKTVGATGQRIVHLEHSAAWDAKSRLPLPTALYLPENNPWGPFAAALDRLRTMTPDALRAAIESELERLGDSFQRQSGETSSAAAVRKAVTAAKDNTGDLNRYLSTLQQASPITAAEETAQ